MEVITVGNGRYVAAGGRDSLKSIPGYVTDTLPSQLVEESLTLAAAIEASQNSALTHTP